MNFRSILQERLEFHIGIKGSEHKWKGGSARQHSLRTADECCGAFITRREEIKTCYVASPAWIKPKVLLYCQFNQMAASSGFDRRKYHDWKNSTALRNNFKPSPS